MTLAQKGRRITVLALACLAAVYVRALAFTPVERLQGPAQKVFYLHVPAARWTETAMILVGLAGIFYLFLKEPRRTGPAADLRGTGRRSRPGPRGSSPFPSRARLARAGRRSFGPVPATAPPA